MVIYNITTMVDKNVAPAWLTWVKEEFIKWVMDTGCFLDFKIVRLLETDETEGLTYAVQFTAISKREYNRYIENYSVTIQEQSAQKWGGAAISFRSVMQVVE